MSEGKPLRAVRGLLTAFRYEVGGTNYENLFVRKGCSLSSTGLPGFEPGKCRNQNPVPYRLAIALNALVSLTFYIFITAMIELHEISHILALVIHAHIAIRFVV